MQNHCLKLISAFSIIFSFVSCISNDLDNVYSAADFDWNTLKRDQILMTPLLDLRGSVVTPAGFENSLPPFSPKESLAYPEIFKQVFFKERKDIRVFGAGGAFEKLSQLENLNDLAQKVLRQEPLPAADVKKIRAANQDIRFIFFLVFAGESLSYDYRFNAPENKHYVEKIYSSIHTMNVKLAMWDSKEEKTVWIGEKILTPTNTSILRFKNPNFKGNSIPVEDVNILLTPPDSFDHLGSSSLSYELTYHRSRFLGFPEREPYFSSSFQHFAFTLPMHPSEKNLIEYNHFTNHRLELGAGASKIDQKSVGRAHLNISSRLYNIYRLGFDIVSDVNSPKFIYEGKSYQVSSSAYGLSNDLEWELSDHWNLLTGASIGFLAYRVQDIEATKAAQNNPQPSSKTSDSGDDFNRLDASFYFRPRIHFLWGRKPGGLLGFGIYYNQAPSLDDPVLKTYKPAPWGAELTASYTWRGI
jgi:hypothetical protein